MGGVKEQTAGLHATKFVEEGFLILTFDTTYQCESHGKPRGLEDPNQQAEDARSAVTYLSMVSQVDPNHISTLGICTSRGSMPFAAQTDVRIKAVAILSAADVGALFHKDMKDTAMTCITEAKGDQPPDLPIVPDDPKNIPPDNPVLFREGSDYHHTPHTNHPQSTNQFPLQSYNLIINYSSYTFIDLISPHPLLMITESNTDSHYFSEDAIARAKEPKELFLVPDQTHVGLYDDLSISFPKLLDFMTKSLAS
ncbi:hypothetical protein PRK78_000928 [Emydomyces testavorans]|uniref:Uncharacterized protein n=1 Tax=Emydomyces testavorans TaxID=2070801 RepID=A0AAF0IG54_9EURO|nr:hypothetical protein PRK78_000928 [Emydomyces testavorans]